MNNLKSIKVKYLSATNNLGNRLKLTLLDGSSKTIARNYSKSINEQVQDFIINHYEGREIVLGKVKIDSDTDIIVLQ